MKRLSTIISLLLTLTMLTACATVGPADGWTPTQEAENACYKMAFDLLPEGAVFHEYIVTSDTVSGAVNMDGYTALKEGEPDLHVRVGTSDLTEDLNGNNCYFDFLYDNKDGHIVAYKFSWKDGYEPVEESSSEISSEP